jgi:hypothetical protein
MAMKRKLIGLGVATALATAGAGHADDVQTYAFTGTLANPLPATSGTSVSGQFTLDQTTGTLVNLAFETPLGAVDSTGAFFGLQSLSPADNPAADFFYMYDSAASGGVALLFESSVASFSGGPLYTGPVIALGGEYDSSLICQGPALCSGASVNFSSGEATLMGVPEPATWTLMLIGLGGLGAGLRWRRQAAPRRSASGMLSDLGFRLREIRAAEIVCHAE